MTIDDFMKEHLDYYLGGISALPEDVPDGAWFQMRVDTIEMLSEPENLRMVMPGQVQVALDFDAYDILMWILTKQKSEADNEQPQI